jgi:hypothetical protein
VTSPSSHSSSHCVLKEERSHERHGKTICVEEIHGGEKEVFSSHSEISKSHKLARERRPKCDFFWEDPSGSFACLAFLEVTSVTDLVPVTEASQAVQANVFFLLVVGS